MKVSVLTYTDYLPPKLIENKIAIVIDVFRATSVITTALVNGVKDIIVTKSVEEAYAEYQKYDSNSAILGGERKMQKIPGFHYGNSPIPYTHNEVSGRTLILTTTNGTQALAYCKKASAIYICSMLNCSSVASSLINNSMDIVIVCAGLSNDFAMEDAICAGMLISYLGKNAIIEIDDFSKHIFNLYKIYARKKITILKNTAGFKKLIKNGFEEDIHFCLQENIYSIVPTCINNRIF